MKSETEIKCSVSRCRRVAWIETDKNKRKKDEKWQKYINLH